MNINKKRSFIIIIPFLLIIVFFAAYALFDTDDVMSSVEGRRLAEKPTFSAGGYFSGEYMRALETYFADTFPCRDMLLRANRKLNMLYSLPIYEQEFYYTPSKSMILYGDAGMELFKYNPESAAGYANFVASCRAALPEGVKVSLLLAPTAAEFNRPPSLSAPELGQKQAIDQVYSHCAGGGVSTVDAYTALEAHRKQYIYYRTDHHWTALGAYYAYTAYVGEENAAPLEDMEEYRLPGFLGTMYKFTSMIPQNSALAENPDEIIYYRQPDAEAYAYSGGEMDDPKPMSVILSPEESDPEFKYSVFLGGDHALVKITTSAAGGKSVLVVKDSYANALIPYLVNNYAVIYIADPRYLGSDDKPFSITKFIADNNVGELLFVNYAVALMNNDWTLLLQRIK